MAIVYIENLDHSSYLKLPVTLLKYLDYRSRQAAMYSVTSVKFLFKMNLLYMSSRMEAD